MARIKVVTLLFVAVLLAAVFFYYASYLTEDSENSYVRREDIYSSQQTIEQSLYMLNQSIQVELEYQKVLADKVAELSVKADIPVPVINTTKIVQQPPTVIKVPSTKPAPVTRAS